MVNCRVPQQPVNHKGTPVPAIRFYREPLKFSERALTGEPEEGPLVERQSCFHILLVARVQKHVSENSQQASDHCGKAVGLGIH